MENEPLTSKDLLLLLLTLFPEGISRTRIHKYIWLLEQEYGIKVKEDLEWGHV